MSIVFLFDLILQYLLFPLFLNFVIYPTSKWPTPHLHYTSLPTTHDAGRNLSSLFGTPRSSTISLAARRSYSFSTVSGGSVTGTPQPKARTEENVIARDGTDEEDRETRMRIVNKRSSSTRRRRKSLSCIGGTGKGSVQFFFFFSLETYSASVLTANPH